MLQSQAGVDSSEVEQSPGIIQSLEAIRDKLKGQLMKLPEYRAFQTIEKSIAEIAHIQDIVDHLEVGNEKIKDRLMTVREYRAILAVEKSITDITDVLGVLADSANSDTTAAGVTAAPEGAAAPETALAPARGTALEPAGVELTSSAAEVAAAPEVVLAVTPSVLPEDASAATSMGVPAVAEKPESSPLGESTQPVATDPVTMHEPSPEDQLTLLARDEILTMGEPQAVADDEAEDVERARVA